MAQFRTMILTDRGRNLISKIIAGSSGVAFTLQIIGQKGLNPTTASLLMSLESVISALAGWAVLGESLSGRELAGCALVFTGVILAQIPMPSRK